jgi:subtilisin-like proprotein convertase family protein
MADAIAESQEAFGVKLSNADGGAVIVDGAGEAAIVERVTYPSSDVPKELQDAKNTVHHGFTTSTVQVTAPGTVLDVNVRLDITHPWVSDLTATLIAPDGTRGLLFHSPYGAYTDGNFTDTVLDDDAFTPIDNSSGATAPFTGTFQPDGSLADFNGLDASGTWTLEIEDDGPRDTGTLNSWAIEMVSYEPEPNVSPIAQDDSDTTNEDTDVIISVLVNDSDDDGDPIDISSVSDPANGAAVDNGEGTITYTPDQDFNGQDTFTYTIDDGKGGTDTATVTVTVNPIADPPGAVDDTAATDEGTAKIIDVLANDSDPDGDTLSVTDVSTPANGTAVINPDDTITYTPDAGFTGTVTFDYTISDGNGGTDTGTVEVTVSPVSSDTPLYVYDIRFVQHDRKADWWQAVFEIRADVDGDGVDGDDTPGAGVAITVNFAGETFSGTTDSNGVFTTSWVRKLQSGTDYYANVVDMVLTDYVWDRLLDQKDDSDGDGDPDGWLNF